MELHITGLSKTYGKDVRALGEVSLSIPTGMFGLLGPNGAGKSTLMRTLATLQDADHGSAQLVDAERGTHINVLRDKAGVRRILSYLPQDFGVYPKINAEDMLDHLARLKGLADRAERREAVATLLRQANLYDVRKKALGGFSGGMLQRSASPRRCSATRSSPSSTSRRPGSTPRSGRASTTCSSRRRGSDRPALDAHRLRRQRPLPAAGDDEQGPGAGPWNAEAADRCAGRPHLGSLGGAQRGGGPARKPPGHLDAPLHRQDDGACHRRGAARGRPWRPPRRRSTMPISSPSAGTREHAEHRLVRVALAAQARLDLGLLPRLLLDIAALDRRRRWPLQGRQGWPSRLFRCGGPAARDCPAMLESKRADRAAQGSRAAGPDRERLPANGLRPTLPAIRPPNRKSPPNYDAIVPPMNADLHCHSTVSDGTLAPEAVAARAKANGVELWALTDHDEIDGQRRARDAALALGLSYLTGTEISVTFAGVTVHIIGLGFDAGDERLAAGLKATRGGRELRAHEMADELAKVGIDGAYEGALRFVGNPDLISRTHFARYLVECGACTNTQDVFRRFLVEGKPGFVPHRWATLRDAVAWIADAGGIAVIAHPARYKFTPTEEYALFTEFKALGGRGVEVVTGAHSAADAEHYADAAREFDLLASRGSDFHSPQESRIDLGGLPPLPAGLNPVWEALAARIHAAA